MSAIIGRVEYGDRHITPESFDGAAGLIKIYGPDQYFTYIESRIAIGSATLGVSRPPPQRAARPAQCNILVTADSIIDNRTELGRSLGLSSRETDAISDAEIISACYDRWGEDCPNHIDGDFAFACINRTTREVFLARDHIGSRPLYWALRDRSFFFSTSIEAIVSFREFDWSIDESTVAEFLCNPSEPVSKPFFAEIQSLSPGSSMMFSGNHPKEKTWWSPSVQRRNTNGSSADAINEARELLERAVAVRCKSIRPVGSHFSGGIDSSAITLLADRSLKAAGNKLTGAYAWAPPNSPEYPLRDQHDERLVINRLAQQYGLNVRYGSLSGDVLAAFQKRALEFENETDLADELPIASRAKADGIGVMLSGWGGDEAFSSHGFGYVGHLAYSGKLKQAVRFIRSSNVNLKSRRAIASLIWGELIHPVLPDKIYHFLGQDETVKPQALIAPELVARTSRTRRKNNNPLKFGINPNRNMLRHLRWGHITRRMESWAVLSAENGFQYRYPLTDRRLLEFLLSLPPSRLYHNDEPRGLAKAATEDMLPRDVGKTDYMNEALRRDARFGAWKAIANEMISGGFSDKCPWIDQSTYTSFASNPEPQIGRESLLKVISVLTATRVWELHRRARKNNWARN